MTVNQFGQIQRSVDEAFYIHLCLKKQLMQHKLILVRLYSVISGIISGSLFKTNFKIRRLFNNSKNNDKMYNMFINKLIKNISKYHNIFPVNDIVLLQCEIILLS